MNVDFRCEHCGKLLSAPARANEPVQCPHCQKLATVPAGLALLPRPIVAPDREAAAATGDPRPGHTGRPAGAMAPPPLPDSPAAPQAAAPPSGDFLVTMERVMPFVISLFFHLGLILVTVFLGTVLIERKEAPKEIVVPGTSVTGDDLQAGGTLTPMDRPTIQAAGGGSRFSKVTDSSVRSTIIAAGGGSGNARPGMGMIGVGGATGGTGEGTGTGTGKWFGGGGGGGSFFGMGPGRGGGGMAGHIVYVVDRSGSMLDTFDAVRLEMLTSIGQLDGAKQDFTIILFADGPPLEPVERRLVPATTEFKRTATDFLHKPECKASGSTDPTPALKRAFEVLEKATDAKGKVIFLLTDGDFRSSDKNKEVLDLCRARNTKKDIHIFTFLYGVASQEFQDVMKAIATENGGKFKVITPE